MVYHYKGFWDCDSKCDLEIIRGDRETLVICTELEDNTGTSVTNFAEQLATLVCREDPSIDPTGLLWVERYPERSAGRWQKPFPESWSLVKFRRRSGRTFGGPDWTSATAATVQALRERVEASRQPLH